MDMAFLMQGPSSVSAAHRAMKIYAAPQTISWEWEEQSACSRVWTTCLCLY